MLKQMEDRMKEYIKSDDNVTRNFGQINCKSHNAKCESSITNKVRNNSKPAGKTFEQFKNNSNHKQDNTGYSSSVCNAKQFKQFFTKAPSHSKSKYSYSKNTSSESSAFKLNQKDTKY